MNRKYTWLLLMILSVGAYGQEDNPVNGFEAYPEKVMVHTDQKLYFPGERLWCKIYVTTGHPLKPSSLSRVCYLELLSADHIPIWQAAVKLESGMGNASWIIPDQISTGAYTVRAYTRWMRNQEVDYFYMGDVWIVNGKRKPSSILTESSLDSNATDGSNKLFEGVLSSTTESVKMVLTGLPATLSTKSAYTLNLSAMQSNAGSSGGQFSASMFRIPDSIAKAWIPGPRDSGPWQTISGENADVMLTTVQDNDKAIYLPESSGPMAEGILTGKRSQNPIANRDVSISIPGKRFNFALARSRPNGHFFIPLTQREGSGEIVFKVLGQDADTIDVRLLSAFDSRFPKHSPKNLSALLANINFVKDCAELSQLNQIYQLAGKEEWLVNDQDDSTAFYGKPEKTYWLDDYTRFSRLEEVFREFVPEVFVRRKKDGMDIRLSNDMAHTLFEENPLLLVNGIPIDDVNKVMSIDAQVIRKIDIVTSRYFYGNRSFSGIINLELYENRKLPIDLPSDMIISEYEGLHVARKYPPYIPGSLSSSPDLRRLLFWEPNGELIPGKNTAIPFSTSDVPGWYALVVYMLSQDGQMVRSTQIFHVHPIRN